MSGSGGSASGALGRRQRWALVAGLLATLALLLAHANLYAFLCDDAFISFRYARNLAEGYGLVFNPGYERVEGYTNFLWVLLLAAVARTSGIAPEVAAQPLSLAATVGLWAALARYAWRARLPGDSLWPVALPTLLLAATRSVAVWSTSGLETRLFELIVLSATLRLARELTRAARAEPVLPVAALLYALGALVRPDGLLFAASALAAAAAFLAARRALRPRWLAAQAAAFLPLVAAQFLWRHAYYGDWLPNTFYVKVEGTWWSMGGAYLASAALEYAIWLWPPLLLIAVRRHARLGSLQVPLLFAAVVMPHALYVASIGGDHFEYRPLDLYFSFAFLLLGDGAFELARTRRGAWLAPAYAALLIAGLVAIPWRSHVESPDHYETGFPGLPEGPSGAARAEYLDPERDPIYRWPGLRELAGLQRALLQQLTAHFVGVRQEEHRGFLLSVLPEAKRLSELRERGVLPADAYFAISCVGAIPYYSRLRILDRFGLTDAAVAHGPALGEGMLAHDRHATLQYAARAGVDFWALDEVHSLLPLLDGRLPSYLARAHASRGGIYVADVGGDEILLGILLQGPESAALRFPKLHFARIGDDAVYGELVRRIESARLP
ncbi:MAG: hypothetical protein ACHQ6T_06255 [Myxococcota bacterium]